MDLISNLISVIALILSFGIAYINTDTTVIDFCDLYANNGFKIDYGFTAWVWNDNWRHILVIDFDYWEILIKPDQNSLTFISEHSQRSDAFGNQIRAAFAFKSGNTYEHGFLSKNSNQIVWKVFNMFIPNVEPSKHVPTDMPFGNDFNPSVAFQMRSEGLFVVCFVDKWMTIEKNIEVYSYSYRLFNFDDTTVSTRFDPIGLQLANDSKQMLDQISTESELIATFIPDIGLEYVYLYKVDKQIKFCFTTSFNAFQKCDKQSMKLLIDCTNTTVRTTLPATETTFTSTETPFPTTDATVLTHTDHSTKESANKSKDNNINTLSVLLIIFLILMLLSSCVLGYMVYRKKSTESNRSDDSENIKVLYQRTDSVSSVGQSGSSAASVSKSSFTGSHSNISAKSLSTKPSRIGSTLSTVFPARPPKAN